MLIRSRSSRRLLAGVTVLMTLFGSAVGTTVGIAAPAQAAPAATFGPTVVSGIPASSRPVTQKVVPLRTITANLVAGQTAYVYSSMRAYDATDVTLIDNEIRCSGAGSDNVVMGENIDPSFSANIPRTNITIVNRFLVSATSTGILSCTIALRSASLSATTSSVTVSGEIRFAATTVGEDASGSAMQTSLPPGLTPLVSTVRTPVLDRILPAGSSSVAVIADVEFQSCSPGSCPDSTDASQARFTLFVNQMNGDAVCASATPAQTDVLVTKQTHHQAVPLYTSVPLQPGCTRLYAYVKAEYLIGPAGSIQGEATGLGDVTGPGGVDPQHDSVMTHIFAVPS